MVAGTGLGMERHPAKIRKAVRSQFRRPCERQDGVRKISHGLRNFRTPCKIFTGVASEIGRFHFG